jgi:hypothetical protein
MEHSPELAAQPPAHPNQRVFESAGPSIYWRRLRGHKPLVFNKKKMRTKSINREKPRAPKFHGKIGD